MDILDIVIRLHCRPFLRQPIYAMDFDLKKITTAALKILFVGTCIHYRPATFSLSLSCGIMARAIKNDDFKFKELQNWIDYKPLSFIKAALLVHAVFLAASHDLATIFGGFYTGIALTKLCK